MTNQEKEFLESTIDQNLVNPDKDNLFLWVSAPFKITGNHLKFVESKYCADGNTLICSEEEKRLGNSFIIKLKEGR